MLATRSARSSFALSAFPSHLPPPLPSHPLLLLSLDSSGFISADSIRKTLGEDVAEQSLNDIIAVADTNGDGLVTQRWGWGWANFHMLSAS